MGRSPSFGSTERNSKRPIQTRFRCGSSQEGIRLAAPSHSLVHYAKGTQSRFTVLANGHSASTACRLTVSGPISLPSPGYFSTFPHGTSALSVTRECLAWARGRARFPQGFTCPVVLGCLRHQAGSLSSTGLITFSGGPFQALRLVIRFFTWRGHRTALP